MKKLISLLPLLLLNTMILFAQKEASIWYFGENAGLDFRSGTPVALTDGRLSTQEGCATICDRKGNLLFYTDGITVWTKNHSIMTNGTGLYGGYSSTNSAVIVPKPGDEDLYYIFTISERIDNFGLNYSIVDISANNGLGRVAQKNRPVMRNVTEKIAVVRDRSCEGYWVITHQWESNAFYAFKLTADGLIEMPVVSRVGSVHASVNGDNVNKRGYMKPSPDGKKIALAICDDGKFEVFDFDNSTGMLSNPITLHKPDFHNSYGVEFSPDGTKLYGNIYTEDDYVMIFVYNISLLQFDLTAGNEAAINNSVQVVYNQTTTVNFPQNRYQWTLGAIQTGPDGKLYIARYLTPSLGVINYPNKKETAIQFDVSGVDLRGRNSMWGLPTYINNYNFNRALVTLPDTTAVIGDTNFRIPVMAKLTCKNQGQTTLDYSLEIRFDAQLYMPKAVTKGTIAENSVVNGEQILVIEDNNVTIDTQNTVITEIIGDVLLGERDSTPLVTTNFTIKGTDIEADTNNGSLKVIGQCQPESRYATNVKPSEMTILPNPAAENLKIMIDSGEPGDFTLRVYSIEGRLLKETNLYSNPGGQFFKEFPLDVSGLSAGSYFVVLKTVLNTYTAPLRIVR